MSSLLCSRMPSWCTLGQLSWWPPASSVWRLRSPTTATSPRPGCHKKRPRQDFPYMITVLMILARGLQLQGDVVYLCWPIAPSYIESMQMRGEGEIAGSQQMSAAVHIKCHEPKKTSQIYLHIWPIILTFTVIFLKTPKLWSYVCISCGG
jgi:hypothetical protein